MRGSGLDHGFKDCIVGVDDVRDASWFDWLVCVGYWHGHVLSNASA